MCQARDPCRHSSGVKPQTGDFNGSQTSLLNATKISASINDFRLYLECPCLLVTNILMSHFPKSPIFSIIHYYWSELQKGKVCYTLRSSDLALYAFFTPASYLVQGLPLSLHPSTSDSYSFRPMTPSSANDGLTQSIICSAPHRSLQQCQPPHWSLLFNYFASRLF